RRLPERRPLAWQQRAGRVIISNGGGTQMTDRTRRAPFLLAPLAPPQIALEVRERFGRFIVERGNPGARAPDRAAARLSRELMREAGDLGLMGWTLPVELGGGGRRWREWGLVLHEISTLTTDTALPMLLAYCGTVTKLLHETGRPDLRDRYVEPMIRG